MAALEVIQLLAGCRQVRYSHGVSLTTNGVLCAGCVCPYQFWAGCRQIGDLQAIPVRWDVVLRAACVRPDFELS
jgi:hypothetical protein